MRLRLGIAGCGGAAQIIHLPVLRSLAEKYELVSVADIRENCSTGRAEFRCSAPIHICPNDGRRSEAGRARNPDTFT
jgi:predicted dehydrogenase